MVKISLYCFLQHLSEDKTVQDVLQNLFHHTKDLRSLHLLLVCICETPPCRNSWAALMVLSPFSWALPEQRLLNFSQCWLLAGWVSLCCVSEWGNCSSAVTCEDGLFNSDGAELLLFHFLQAFPFLKQNRRWNPLKLLFPFWDSFWFLVNPDTPYWNLFFLLELPSPHRSCSSLGGSF